MKNPNSYGSVFKLGGNRRRPWCARVTIGWSDEGKLKYKNIGYYEEREEAMIALTQYNCDPCDLDNNQITFAEIYEKWSEEKFPKVSQRNHLPHDCRHTAATKLFNAEVNSTIIKLILGHSSDDVTERVYTHKTYEQLVEAINKI